MEGGTMSLTASLRAWRERRAERRREQRAAEAEAIRRGALTPSDSRRADYHKIDKSGPG
jgi:hypothetical protein